MRKRKHDGTAAEGQLGQLQVVEIQNYWDESISDDNASTLAVKEFGIDKDSDGLNECI